MVPRDIWIEIIKDFQQRELPDIIERDVKIPTDIPIKRVITIIGPRRAGKTYIMFQLIKQISKKIPENMILYINFEDDRLINADVKDLRNMLDIFYEIYPENKNNKVYLFFDEIQNIENWEKFTRAIMDSEKVQLFVSGSSSKMLSEEIATSLRGRGLTYKILPFSFAEILKAKNFVPEKFLSSGDKARLLNYLDDYLYYGGYPETVLLPQERKKIIGEILNTTIYRDIIERHNIRNIKIAKIMLNHLFTSTIFSVNKFYGFLKTTGYKVSKNTIYNYFEYFRDSLVVYPLRKYSASYRKIESSLPKIYLISNGLLSVTDITDKGRLMENLVFVELMHNSFKPNENIFYYLTSSGKEVDFVIVENKNVKQLIQVCYDLSDYNTKEREMSALIRCSDELKCNNLLIITYDYENLENFDGKKINFIPLWKWLLKI